MLSFVFQLIDTSLRSYLGSLILMGTRLEPPKNTPKPLFALNELFPGFGGLSEHFPFSYLPPYLVEVSTSRCLIVPTS